MADDKRTDAQIDAILAKDPVNPLTTDSGGLEAPQYTATDFINGDYKAPKAVWDAAMKVAGEALQSFKNAGIDPEKVSYLKDAAKLDGKAGITQQELASQLLAISMANNTTTGMRGTVTAFDNEISERDIRKALENPKHLAALAKQVFGDNNPNLSPTDTTTPQGNAADLPNIIDGGSRVRC